MAGFEHLCMNCMADTGGKPECPTCGYRNDGRQTPHALPFHTRLQNRYIVGRVKSSNGEGVTYIGYDTVLNVAIELREFFPQTLCERAPDGTAVRVMGGSELIFDECLASFLNYSREVAHLRGLSAIQQIYDIFEENHTAYTVAEWQESITLHSFVERSGGSLPWNTARPLFMPVLSALSSMHAAGVRHLGVSPETLLITKEGKMKLSCFCIDAVRRMDNDLPPDLVAGCASIEQYVMDYMPNEATDVYGFAASLFFALTGNLPQDALRRRTDSRLLIPTSTMRSLPGHVVTALANALQVSPDKRTPTFERLRAELSAAPTVTATVEMPRAAGKAYPAVEEPAKKKGGPAFVWVLVPCAVVVVVFAAVALVWFGGHKPPQGVPAGSGFSAGVSSVSSQADSQASEPQESESQAENQLEVPNLVNQEYEKAAEDAQKNSGYQLLARSKREFSDTVKEGVIISQSPTSGEKMEKGGTIVVTVSRGKAQRELPAVKGKPLSEASVAVTGEGFTATKVEEYSDTVAAGLVIGYKGNEEGQELAYGSPVILIVSKGPDPALAAG